jgi:hypothetical protein
MPSSPSLQAVDLVEPLVSLDVLASCDDAIGERDARLAVRKLAHLEARSGFVANRKPAAITFVLPTPVVGFSRDSDGVQALSFTGTCLRAASLFGRGVHSLSGALSGVTGISNTEGPTAKPYSAMGSSNANSLCGQNSAGSRKSMRPFKGIIYDDISEFESDMPSHAVRSLWLLARRGITRDETGYLAFYCCNPALFENEEAARTAMASWPLWRTAS